MNGASQDHSSDAAGVRGRRALVTGATGFLGRHLCARLRSDGAHVVGVSRYPSASVDADAQHEVDLCEAPAVRGLVEETRPDIVFHLAGWVRGAREAEWVLPALHSNLLSTVHLLDASLASGCPRFVQAGSLEEAVLDAPAAAPSSPYAASKMAATAYCRMFAELYGLPVTLARIFMVYGPGPQDENKLVPHVVQSQLRGEAPTISSGTRRVDWVYVDDVVEGLVRMATTEGVVGQQVDLGTGRLHTVREVAETLCELAGRGLEPSLGAVADRAQEQERRADTERTKALLGWAPATPLERGLQQTLAWFEARAEGSEPAAR